MSTKIVPQPVKGRKIVKNKPKLTTVSGGNYPIPGSGGQSPAKAQPSIALAPPQEILNTKPKGIGIREGIKNLAEEGKIGPLDFTPRSAEEMLLTANPALSPVLDAAGGIISGAVKKLAVGLMPKAAENVVTPLATEAVENAVKVENVVKPKYASTLPPNFGRDYIPQITDADYDTLPRFFKGFGRETPTKTFFSETTKKYGDFEFTTFANHQVNTKTEELTRNYILKQLDKLGKVWTKTPKLKLIITGALLGAVGTYPFSWWAKPEALTNLIYNYRYADQLQDPILKEKYFAVGDEIYNRTNGELISQKIPYENTRSGFMDLWDSTVMQWQVIKQVDKEKNLTFTEALETAKINKGTELQNVTTNYENMRGWLNNTQSKEDIMTQGAKDRDAIYTEGTQTREDIKTQGQMDRAALWKMTGDIAREEWELIQNKRDKERYLKQLAQQEDLAKQKINHFYKTYVETKIKLMGFSTGGTASSLTF